VVARGDAPGGTDNIHHLRFAYYEPFADGLDTAAETDGWDVLVEFAEAYDPDKQGEFPEVGHVIANALGRSLIRTGVSSLLMPCTLYSRTIILKLISNPLVAA
jgi:hypothetical protein